MHRLKTPGRLRPLLGLWIGTALAACGPRPACRQIESSGQSMVSWAATAEMVAQRWTAGDVPTAYAHNTLTKGAQEARRAAAKLGQAPAAPVAREAQARYAELAVRLARIDAVIADDDGRAAAGLAAGLPAIRLKLDRLQSGCQAR
jgi:hypothetical protein